MITDRKLAEIQELVAVVRREREVRLGKSPRKSKWDHLIFEPIKSRDTITIDYETSHEARKSANEIRAIAKRRTMPGFVIAASNSGKRVTITKSPI